VQLSLDHALSEARLSLPTWLPDESLFSWASRYHLISGSHRASDTCLALFGHPQQGSQHDFPTRLDHLASATQGLLGDAPSIIQDRTILPFYLHFVGLLKALQAIEVLRGNMLSGLKFQLGLVTSGFRAHHPLKACDDCLIHDLEAHGTPYWHVAHQYPGVWICPAHQRLLRESTIKSTGVGRFQWHLPHLATLAPTPYEVDGSKRSGIGTLAALGELSVGLARLPLEAQFDQEALRRLYLTVLHERGLATPSHRLRLQALTDDYQAFVQPLQGVPELAAFHGDNAAVATMLGGMLRAPRNGTHPLRHLVIILWLFRDWAAFLDAYRTQPLNQPGAETSAQLCVDKTPTAQERAFLDCIRDGQSATQCAKRAGIDVSTALVWASRHGFPIRRRPKTVTAAVADAIAASLRTGAEKTDLAIKHGVSASTIDRILQSVAGLHGDWRMARLAMMQSRARTIWSRAVTTDAALGISHLRALHPSTYAWLHRHDRTWLADINAPVPPVKPKDTKPRVDWASRDNEMAAKVREAVETLHAREEALNQRVHLWQIYQVLPELKAKLGALRHLPLTRHAIDTATRPYQSSLF
jgi:hypothetical protein